MHRIVIALACLFLPLLTPWSVRAEEPYLFDLLDRPSFRHAWVALVAGEKHVPEWLAQYAATTDGPSRPSQKVTDLGSGYRLAWVCKTHDCGDNQFYVLFSEDGKKAWGMLLEADKPERFFGAPSKARQRLLREAMHRG